MNAKEQEYMDYLIHNRMELTNQITRHLDRIDLLEKKLEIATKALNRIREVCVGNPKMLKYITQFANRKVKTTLKELEEV